MKHVMVVRHVRHESIGTLEHYLRSRSLGIEFADCFAASSPHLNRGGFDPRQLAGLVVMGGPMNVDETERYPFLATEVRWLRQAVEAGLPTLGICLGSQLLAGALDGRVRSHRIKEIGWHEIELLPPACDDPLFAGSRPTETVFQWHGDTFDLPAGAVQLARGRACEQQAFRFGSAAYGLQFHIEMTAEMVEDWLAEPDMCAEIAALDYVDPHGIRGAAADALARMAPLAQRVLGGFAALCHERAAAMT